MDRGAGRRAIFRTKSHRKKFLELLAEAKEMFGIETMGVKSSLHSTRSRAQNCGIYILKHTTVDNT